MKYAFYITNHGFGHASRNVPIIKKILKDNLSNHIYIKTDAIRCDFLKRNLSEFIEQISYHEDCKENGLILQTGKMIPDLVKMKKVITTDFLYWNQYIERESQFLLDNKIDVVVADIIPWAIKAAKLCKIPSVLIGNFNWSEMYKSYYGKEIWEPYSNCYKLADKAIWYEIHAKELHNYCRNFECVSLVSRTADTDEVKKIQSQFSKNIIFVSLGASAELSKSIYVEDLPYEFLITRGLNLEGKNVHVLPDNMINTPDYIAASKYVIAKGGWSTVAEILLQKKKCALIFRGDNSEDNHTKAILEGRNQCIGLESSELFDIKTVINRIEQLDPDSYNIYQDDTDRICRIITEIAHKG